MEVSLMKERTWTTELGAHMGQEVRLAGWLHRLRRLVHALAYGRLGNAALFGHGNEIAETPEVHFCYTDLV